MTLVPEIETTASVAPVPTVPATPHLLEGNRTQVFLRPRDAVNGSGYTQGSLTS